MANASIFNQFLQRPKSVVEYGAELDAQEANQLSLADARRKGVAADESVRERNAIKQLLAGGADLSTQEGLRSALPVAPGLAVDYAGKIAKVKGDTAKAAKDEQDAVKVRFDNARTELTRAFNEFNMINDPGEFMDAIAQRMAEGKLDHRVGSTLLRTMPPEVEKFPAFKEKMLNMVSSRKEQLDAVETFLQTLDSGNQITQQLRLKHGGGVVPGTTTVTPKQQSPDSAATERTAIRGQDVGAQSRIDAASIGADNRAPVAVQGPNGPVFVRPQDAVGQPAPDKTVGKQLPTSAAQKLMENQQNLRRAEQALMLVEGKNVGNAVGDKDATGLKNYLPDALIQRADTKGVDTRAAIADLGSLIIHDRSGAAVTAAEFPRLRPFIPQATDAPETAKKKLARFVQEYRNIARETVDFYTESGYRVPEETLRGADSGTTTTRQAPKIPKVGEIRDGYRFKGGNPADQRQWEATR